MEKTEIIKIIDQIEDYRFKRMRRDNIQWHLDKDLAGGYMALARDRKRLLIEAQTDLNAIEADAKSTIDNMRVLYSSNPNDKALRLIMLYIDMLDMEPMKLEKHRQKINTLRPKVLGLVDEIDEIRNQMSLF